MNKKRTHQHLLIIFCSYLSLAPMSSAREIPQSGDIPPPKNLPQNINAIWTDSSSLVLIFPSGEKDKRHQMAIHEDARKRSFLQRGKQGYTISKTPNLDLPPLSRRQMEEDFDAFVKIVKEVLPTVVVNKIVFGLEIFSSLEGFRKKVAEITSTEQFVSLLAEAIGSCKGSHFRPARLSLQKYRTNEWLRKLTEGFLDEASVQAHENYLPLLESRNRLSPLDLSLVHFEGGYFTLYDFIHEGSIYPKGLKVLRCNGEAPAQIVSRIQGRLDNRLPWDFERKTFYSEEFYRSVDIVRNGRLEFEFKRSSGEILRAVFASGSTVTKKIPQRDTSKLVRYIDQEKILYIRVPTMDPQDLEFYISGIQMEAKKGQLRAVLIDIRNNGGGSDTVWRTILAHVLGQPIEYQGRLGIKNSPINMRYLPRHPFGQVILSDCRPEKILFLDEEEFLLYSYSSRLEPAQETLGFGGPIFVLSEKVYSAAGSLVTLAAQAKNIVSIGLRNPYILGIGIDPYYFSLPNSKFIFTIEPVIDLTNCQAAEDVFHTAVEIELEPTLEEMLRFHNFENGIPLENFLRKHDPFFRKVLEVLSGNKTDRSAGQKLAEGTAPRRSFADRSSGRSFFHGR